MTTGTYSTNTGAIEGYFTKQQNAKGVANYKWNLQTTGVRGELSSPEAKDIIDKFVKSASDVGNDGIISTEAEVKAFTAVAKAYDADAIPVRSALHTAIKTAFDLKFPGNADETLFQDTLNKIFNSGSLSNVNLLNLTNLDSLGSVSPSEKEKILFVIQYLKDFQSTADDLTSLITELEAKAKNTSLPAEEMASAKARLTTITTLKTLPNREALRTQTINAVNKLKAEAEISTFFTTQKQKEFSASEANIQQIVIGADGKPVVGVAQPMPQSQTDEELTARVSEYARSQQVGTVDTIAALADRVTTRLAEVKRRIDNPKIEAALIAFVNKSADVSSQMQTRRVALSHMLGSLTEKDEAQVFIEAGDNSAFRKVLISSILGSKDKKSPENTYLFLTGILQDHYSVEFGASGALAALPPDATEAVVAENLGKMIGIFKKGLDGNRAFMNKVKDALSSGDLISESTTTKSSIWKILNFQADKGGQAPLLGAPSVGGSPGNFNTTFPARMSALLVTTAKSAKIPLRPSTNINEFLTSIPEAERAEVKTPVASFAFELGEKTKNGSILEGIKRGLVENLNKAIGLRLDPNGGTANIQNDVPPDKRKEAQIIIGKLILVEQAIAVRTGLIETASSSTKPDYFNSKIVESNPKVTTRVKGLLGEFQKQETAYDEIINKVSGETLAPLGEALNGIFNFDIGLSPTRSYAYGKDDLNITRALVQMVLVEKVNSVITKTELGKNGALSADGNKPADQKTTDAATVLGMVNTSIQNLVGEATKAQEANAKLGESLVNGVTGALAKINLTGEGGNRG